MQTLINILAIGLAACVLTPILLIVILVAFDVARQKKRDRENNDKK